MNVINPVGRNLDTEKSADYSILRTTCKCAEDPAGGSNVYQTGSGDDFGGNCACYDGHGTVGTRVIGS